VISAQAYQAVASFHQASGLVMNPPEMKAIADSPVISAGIKMAGS
jgi:hypothetical protein